MLIENVMYFALGALVAGLIALVILPAVWKRAVRLTKRRIEAATPITMAEFRADKDQLRAEFALSTRRLEMNVETLRRRLAEQLGDVNQKRSDLGALKAERDTHVTIVKELEARETDLRARVAELEREGTDLAQRLRMRERTVDERDAELGRLRQGAQDGDYEELNRVSAALEAETRRAQFLEEQARSLLARLETSDRRSVETTAAIAQMREALNMRQDSKSADAENLLAAEARIASAENRLNALLAETGQIVEKSEGRAEQLLADKLGLEAEVEDLRRKVANVEGSIMADWDSDRVEEAHLRERLNDIAASVSRLVYAVDTANPVPRDQEESLFDRVQRYADDGESFDALPATQTKPDRSGKVSDRMAALREIQGH